MTSAFLRQTSVGGTTGRSLPPYQLSDYQEVVLGRDPACQIALDANIYTVVSRRHATIRPQQPAGSGWELCDLNSANGTYINGQRLQGCQTLRMGDRISLGQEGPVFVFESSVPNPHEATRPYTPPSAVNYPPPVAPGVNRPPDSVSFTQLFPIISTGRDLRNKAFLVPGIFTVLFVVSMFVSVGNPILFNLLLSSYLAGAAYYFVYQLCGKRKPWWVLIGAMIFTIVILLTPVLNIFIFVFRGLLPGNIPNNTESIGFIRLFIAMFFGAGMMEELIKALPVFFFALIGRSLQSPRKERIGVVEPLDGILIGTASAVGFTLLETLGQYVPGIINSVSSQGGPEGLGQLVGLQLLIPRILGSVAGHMAYSGYFGYFIGLSALKPSKRWVILLVGYLSAATLHALWNTAGSLSVIILVLIGVLSYAVLAAAILKARALSPSRAQNFATRFFNEPK